MLTNEENQKIANHFDDAFHHRVCAVLRKYADIWRLEQVALIDYFSVNCLFTCHSKIYGDAVLKVCAPSNQVATEIEALREHDDDIFCKMLAFSIEDSVILEEAIRPGTQLRAVQSTAERIKIFLSLYSALHIRPDVPEKYPTYSRWVEHITSFMSAQKDPPELYQYMREAYDICQSIQQKYNQKMLLHGDFHHDNILLSAGGKYKVIDPKGVVGDPIFDIPRFILNEFDDDFTYEENYNHIACVINSLSAGANLPAKDIRRVFFVEMAMATCWSIESGKTPDMDDVKMAYSMLDLNGEFCK